MARIAALLTLALFTFAAAAPADADAAKRKCKKGYVLKKVKRNGKTVKRCVKKKKPKQPANDQINAGGDDTGTGGDDTGTGGGNTEPATVFPRPESQQTGDAAFQLIAPYFANSHFTDCPGGGWGVTCSVEEVYRHCAGGGQTGNFEYHRYTPTSGADINSYGAYQVTAAESNPDGSWGVEYVVDSYGNLPYYSWRVGADGTAYLNYYFPSYQGDTDGPQQYGPLVWEQPAGC